MSAFLIDEEEVPDSGLEQQDASGPARGQFRRDAEKLLIESDQAIRSYAADPIQGAGRLAKDLAIGVPLGITRLAVRADDAFLDLVNYPFEQGLKALGQDELAAFFRRADEDRALNIQSLRSPEDAQFQGFISDLSEQLAVAAVGAGVGSAIGLGARGITAAAAIGAGGIAGKITSDQLVEAGVDPTTAGIAGLQSAAINTVGAAAPGSLGGPLLSRLASGAAINVGFGVADRLSTAEYLKAHGYTNQARSFEALAPEALALDLLLGAGFAALDAEGRPKDTRFRQKFGRDPDPLEVDAALGVLHQRQGEQSPLGVALDGRAVTAHRNALNRALEQAAAGERIDVEEFFQPAPRLTDESPQELLDTAQEIQQGGNDFEAAALAELAQQRGGPTEAAAAIIDRARAAVPTEERARFDADMQARARQLESERVSPNFLEIDRLEVDEAVAKVVSLLRDDPELGQIVQDLVGPVVDPADEAVLGLIPRQKLDANAPKEPGVLASARAIDGIGFFSAVEASVKALPAERWGMGWTAVRSSLVKGRGVDGYAGRVKDEIDYLGLDDAFGGSRLRGEELRRAVGEYVELHKLVLDERFNRFDPKDQGGQELDPFYKAGIRRGPGDLRLPGDDPVFELRLKLPPGVPGSDFLSHWSSALSNDDGVLVSVRGEERIDDAGKRTLFGGEVQSDLAQFNRQSKKIGEAVIPAPLTQKTSQWTNAAVRALVFRAARDRFDSVSFPTGETSTLIQGNNSAAAHYDTNVKASLEKVAALLGGQVRDGGVRFTYEQSNPTDGISPEPIDGPYDGPQFVVMWAKDGEIVDPTLRYRTLADAERAAKDLFNQSGDEAFAGRLGDTLEPPAVRKPFREAPAYILDITPQMREQVLRQGFPLFGSQASQSATPASIATERLKADLSRAFGLKRSEIEPLIASGRLSIYESAESAETALGRSVGNAAGGYLPGSDRAFIIADRVAPEQAYRVVLHEVGVHAGLPAMLGKKRWAQIQDVLRDMAPLPLLEGQRFRDLVQTLRDNQGRDANLIGDEVIRLAAEHDVNPAIVQAWAEAQAFAVKGYEAEEAFAYLVENAPDLPLVRRLLAQIRQWLWRTFGPEFGPKLTIDDLQFLAVAALRREARLAQRRSSVASDAGANPNLLASFAGPKAKTSDQAALAEAKRLERGGLEPFAIWEKTGWHRGPGKNWRFTIPDDGATLIGNPKPYKTLSEILDHPKLFEAYPWLKDLLVAPSLLDLAFTPFGSVNNSIAKQGLDHNYNKTSILWNERRNVQAIIDTLVHDGKASDEDIQPYRDRVAKIDIKITSLADGIAKAQKDIGSGKSRTIVGGEYRPYSILRMGGVIVYPYPFVAVSFKQKGKALVSTLLHEVQHAIQDYEGGARFASILSHAFKTYWSNPTEVEARLTQDLYERGETGFAMATDRLQRVLREEGTEERERSVGDKYAVPSIIFDLARGLSRLAILAKGGLIAADSVRLWVDGLDQVGSVADFLTRSQNTLADLLSKVQPGMFPGIYSFAQARTPDQRAQLAAELEPRPDGRFTKWEVRQLYVWRTNELEFAVVLTARTDTDAPVRVTFGELQQQSGVLLVDRQNFSDIVQAERNLQMAIAGIERDIREHQRRSYVFVGADDKLERLYTRLLSRLEPPDGYVLAQRDGTFAIIRADEVARTLGGEDGALNSAVIHTTNPVEPRPRIREEDNDLRAAARGDLRLPGRGSEDPDVAAARDIARDDPELVAPITIFGPARPLRAKEVMKLVALQQRAADQLAPAFDAAAECAIRNGFGFAQHDAPLTLLDHPRVQGLLVSQTLVLAGTLPASLVLWEQLFLNGQTPVIPPRIARDQADFKAFLGATEIKRNPGFKQEEPSPTPIPSRAELDRQKGENLALVDTDKPLSVLALKAGDIVGIDGKFLEKLALKESGGVVDAQPIDPETGEPLSSAVGLTQFIEGTWLDYMDKYGASHGFTGDLQNPDDRQKALKLRFNPIWSLVMAGHLAQDNGQALRRALGRDATERELYLAHFAGADGAMALIRANDNELAPNIMPLEASANPGLYYDRSGAPRTVGRIKEQLGKSFSELAPKSTPKEERPA